MLPSVLARQLKRGISDYVLTTFPITDEGFKLGFQRLIDDGNGLFHEPYITIKLPFKTTGKQMQGFEAFDNSFIPYVHQQKAFDRLVGSDARSTLIATGTGSGKTECFLYPILEHCYQHRGERGIKALLIYPMNALASDQAKRIAELINSNPNLRNGVAVGMYVGGYEKEPNKVMKSDAVITDRDTMLANPPDILMTNYKMLDYLLVRPKDAKLWNENDPETLKYIAVDEIHTFDGAQGTDLACLLRRLKSRLFTPIGHLCCIGTSATLGSDDNGHGIIEYARNLFGEQFDDNAVVTEERTNLSDFINNDGISDFTVPTAEQVANMAKAAESMDQDAYLQLAANSWLDTSVAPYSLTCAEGRVALGKCLLSHKVLSSILNIIRNNYISLSDLITELAALYPAINDWQEPIAGLEGLLALVSYARTMRSDGKIMPFLTVQEQLWLKELRRLEARVAPADKIDFAVSYDLNQEQEDHYLPVINCHECGATGWVSKYTPTAENIALPNLESFYTAFFSSGSTAGIKMLFPCNKEDADKAICPHCMHLQDVSNTDTQDKCRECGHDVIYVKVPNIERTSGHSAQFRCPCCNSENGLALMGMRSATEISAGLSLLYSSRFNDDKKLLAFSDNVQDAALRAGFFNARTWHVCLRMAIEKFLTEQGRDLSFTQFTKDFEKYWRDKLTSEEYISRFLPSGLTWMRAYEKMKASGTLNMTDTDTSKMFEYLGNRLKYEIYYEFGKRSDIGRTLEKSLCAILKFDLSHLNGQIEALLETLQNEIGELRDLKLQDLKNIVAGILFILRRHGAISHLLNDSAVKKENSIDLTNMKNPWMPHSISNNLPIFVADKQTGRFKFDLLNSEKSWYYKWLSKYVEEMDPYARADVEGDLLSKVINWLTRVGCLKCYDIQNRNHAWGINSDYVKVTDDVVRLTCSECGQSVSVPRSDLEYWQGSKCLRSNCLHGILEENDQSSYEDDYYSKLYRNSDIVRIFASEHTGLMQRDDREELEREFKDTVDRKPWYPNLLSCTPTLEMGIDIGNLSTIIMCSVPPTASQYIQRSGRGGRKDGNALNVTVANSQAHDLYFFADPMEMIQGKVNPPRIFLNASAVLERQFIAYAMDNWVKEAILRKTNLEKLIPDKILPSLNNIKKTNRSGDIFPFNFIGYIKYNVNTLKCNFFELFGENLDNETRYELDRFIVGSGTNELDLTNRLVDSFVGMSQQRETIRLKIQQLKKRLKELEEVPKDSSYDKDKNELKSEVRAYGKIVADISSKNTFNFLSDEGLLPNYAFPEEGITLQAVLLRKGADDGNVKRSKYEKLGFEYRRSASAAISEFAPENTFYAEGHKLTIDTVDLKLAKSDKWRLCPNCSHAEMDDPTKHEAVCPVCGSPDWSDIGQVKNMLRVKLLSSTMDLSESIIEDEVEGRRPKFYCKDMLVDIDEDHDIVKAYKLDDEELPFGYEFVKKATMREINFGEISDNGTKLAVAGESAVRKGFKVCKHCGTVQTDNPKQRRKHSPSCKLWRNEQAATEDDFIDCMFLYREFTTEALRILIPNVGLMPSNIRCESFVAAFMLGLKEHFGNVDHLRSTVSDAGSKDGLTTRRYLVVYDSVPGGTGYLKQLMNTPEEMMQIFEQAANVIENCECRKDKTKHGCYKCLYAYRQSRNIGEISNDVALKLLKPIIERKDKLVKIDKISSIPVNSLIESELEELFVDSFQGRCKITRQIVGSNNKNGYYIIAGKNCAWEMEPQVYLSQKDGVAVDCKPDFILRPKGVLHKLNEAFDQKPIAVFTDGFMYHKNIVYDDTCKRMAVAKSGKYRVWSLTWKDVKDVTQRQGDYARAVLQNNPTVRYVRQRLEQKNFELKRNAFDQLIEYMSNQNAEVAYTKEAIAQSANYFDPNLVSSVKQKLVNEKQLYFKTIGLTDLPEINKAFVGTTTDGSINVYSCVEQGNARLLADKNNYGEYDIKLLSILEDREECRNDDTYERDWNGFWNFANIMQFLPGFYTLTQKGLADNRYDDFAEQFMDNGDSVEDGSPWNEVYELLTEDDAVIALAKELSKRNIAVPVVGYEIANNQGTVVAEAEMAWEELHIAYLINSEDRLSAEKEGWQVYTDNTILDCEAFREVHA